MRANEAVRFGLGRSGDSGASLKRVPKRFRSGFGASARFTLQNEVRQAMRKEVSPGQAAQTLRCERWCRQGDKRHKKPAPFAGAAACVGQGRPAPSTLAG